MRATIALFCIGLAAASTESTLQKYEHGSVFWDEVGPTLNQDTSIEGKIGVVFIVTASIFSCVGLLWFLFSRLTKETPNYELFRIGLNCLTYAACSITMHALNKSLATTLQEPSLIAIAQMIVAVGFFGTVAGKQLLEADRKALLTWCIVPITFSTVLISSFYTYQYISLSMLTIMRNLMPLVVLPVEMIVMPPENKPKANTQMIFALVTMLLGAAVYGGTLAISLLGVAFAVFNMLIGTTDRLIQKRLLTDHCKSLPSGVCSILNNGVSIFPTMMLAFATNEFGKASTPQMVQIWTDPMVLILLLVSGFVGMGVGYFGMEAQRDISATSLFVLQNLAKLGVVFLGIAVFADPIKSLTANIGLLLSLSGSAWYGYQTMQMQEQQKLEKQKLINEDPASPRAKASA